MAGLTEPMAAAPTGTRRPTALFWRCASGFWRAPRASGAWALTAVLTAAVVVQLTLQYRLNYWSRDFFDAFGRKDAPALRQEALLFLLLAGLSIFAAVVTLWARMTMQRRWRAWLTRRLMDRWLAKENFRHLQFQASEDPNPEFRIAEDARVATEAPINLAAGLLSSALSAMIFIGVLWHVGGDLTIELFGYGLTVPKYLVITVAVYSALLTLAMTVIGRRLVDVIAGKNAAEAEFRAAASNVREQGDAPPDVEDSPADQMPLDDTFNAVIRRWRALCVQLMRTTLVSHGNGLAAPIIAWALCAPKYLTGTMSLGEVAQAVAAFVMVQTSLNWLVDNYPGLAECSSSVNRVASLIFALDELENAAVLEGELCLEQPRISLDVDWPRERWAAPALGLVVWSRSR
jgi:putative ATP-binding cassette transporter